MKLRLHEGIPWSQDELTGFAVAVLGAAILATLLMAAIVPDTIVNPNGGPGRPKSIPNPDRQAVPLTFVYVSAALLLLNYSPIKRQRWYLQYAVCVVISMCAGVADLTFRRDGIAVMTVIHLIMGILWFLVFRVNWWFYWDNPSRRSIGRRVAASIFFTGIAPLGLGLAAWRLVIRIGVHDVTTQFVGDSANPGTPVLETIIEDPALADHARRVDAIRAAQAGMGSGRKTSENKDAVSESN